METVYTYVLCTGQGETSIGFFSFLIIKYE